MDKKTKKYSAKYFADKYMATLARLNKMREEFIQFEVRAELELDKANRRADIFEKEADALRGRTQEQADFAAWKNSIEVPKRLKDEVASLSTALRRAESMLVDRTEKMANLGAQSWRWSEAEA